MSAIDSLKRTKNYVLDQARRHTERHIGKRLRMAKGQAELARRQELAATVQPGDCLPTTRLKEFGYSPIQCDPALTQAFVAHCQRRLQTTQEFKQRGSKAFFSQLFVEEDYRLDGPIMQFVLNERLLKTISTYLGSAPFLQSAELLYSRPMPGPLKTSQMWHRDRLDEMVMKVFVYCMDVGPDNGPFTFIPKDLGQKVPEWHFQYIKDEDMRKHVPDSEVQTLLGPTGSTLLIDSYGCFHQGSRCKEPRLAAIIDFDTGFGFQERRGCWKVSAEEKARLTPWQQQALGVAEV